MKRIFALLVVLAMLLSTAALAEESTLYTLALLDPQITVGEETIDLTNLEFELSAAVTDGGPLSLILEAYAGEEYEYITSLFAQLDENGFGVYYNGMENMYIADIGSLTGMSTADLLSALPLRTLLAQSAVEEAETESSALTAEDRIAMLESALGSYVYESLQQDDATVHHFSISREQGAALIAPALAMAAAVSPELAELAEIDIAFDLGGSITAKGSPNEGDAEWTVDSEGAVYLSSDGEEIAVPIALTYSDDMTDFNLTLSLTADDETISLSLDGTSDVLSDGRSSADYTLTLNGNGEEITLRFAVLPEEGTDRVDMLIEMALSDESYLALDVITDFDTESTNSFYAALTVDDGTGESVMDFYYTGDPYEDPEAGLDTVGWAEISVTNPGMDAVTFGAIIYTTHQDMDTEYWLLDSSGAIDITGMTDDDTEAAMNDAMAVFQSDLSAAMEKVPAMADLFS